jgi:hypothetical protein
LAGVPFRAGASSTSGASGGGGRRSTNSAGLARSRCPRSFRNCRFGFQPRMPARDSDFSQDARRTARRTGKLHHRDQSRPRPLDQRTWQVSRNGFKPSSRQTTWWSSCGAERSQQTAAHRNCPTGQTSHGKEGAAAAASLERRCPARHQSRRTRTAQALPLAAGRSWSQPVRSGTKRPL